MPTFKQQVEEVRGILSQYVTNRPIVGTFTGWVGTAPNYTGIGLSGLPSTVKVVNALVELGPELVYVSTHDPNTGETTCPPWFRQQQGTPAYDDAPVNSKAVLNPQFPFYFIARNLLNGIGTLYPNLFVPKTVQLTSELIKEKYVVPDDCDEIISIRYEFLGPVKAQREIQSWTLDHLAIDGFRYLHVYETGLAGRPIYVTYRAKPVLPSVTGDADWSATGLPDTACDLPVLWAAAQMLPSADAAKVQTMSVEQSERNKYVQIGSAVSASKRYQDLFAMRLNEEKRKLHDRFPLRVHRQVN